MSRGAPSVLIVPGLRDHSAEHWQTLLAAKLATTRKVRTLPLLGRRHLSCGERVRLIQHELETIDGPVILVAHSGGVIVLAHWAQWYERAGIAGALLAAPADLETPLPAGYPTMETLQAHGWLPMPRNRLPFPSIVAASSNDPLASLPRVERLAQDWGSACVHVGAVGHLNPASGFGEWPQAEALIAQFDHPVSVQPPGQQ
jgi:predicted alpha/beta hydrolase family esterase